MDKDWSAFNVKYFAIPMTMLVFGLVIGFGLAHSEKKHKDYPIEVEVCYETKGYWYTNTIECDSIKGDSIYKGGYMIVNKNIVNIVFK